MILNHWVLGGLALLACSLTGLVAIWASLGQPHWFVRLAVLGALLALFLPITAYDLLLVLSCQCVTAMLPLLLVRRVGAAEGSLRPLAITRFAVLDLLLATVWVTAIVAVAMRVPADVWDRSWERFELWFDLPSLSRPILWCLFTGLGLLLGISTFVAAWVGLAGSRVWLRVTVAYLLTTIVVTWAGLAAGPVWLRVSVAYLVPTCSLMATWLILLRASRGRNRSVEAADAAIPGRAAGPVLARTVLAATTLLIVMPLGAVYVWLVTVPPLPAVSEPEPNGYPVLLECGRRATELVVRNAEGTWPPAKIASETGRICQEARAALTLECRVAPRYHSSSYTSYPRLLRNLVRTLDREASAVKQRGNLDEAGDIYVDLIRLSRAIVDGGVAIDECLGSPFQDYGERGIAGLRGSLSAAKCLELIRTIDAIEQTSQEPVEDIRRRTEVWEMHEGGWQGRLDYLLGQVWYYPGNEYMEQALRSLRDRSHARLRLLITELAISAYVAERGHEPETLNDLVPQYLAAIPEDPFSGRPLTFAHKTKGYVLYSVGPNRRDDGGSPKRWGYPGGDLLLLLPGEWDKD